VPAPDTPSRVTSPPSRSRALRLRRPVALAVAVVIVAVALVWRASPALAPTPATPVEGVYGSAVGMDSLSNTLIGGPQAEQASYRFRATVSAPLAAIRVYVIGPSHDGYGAGTGGAWEVTVRPDDGTAAHGPSATVLASSTMQPVDGFPQARFATPPALVAGVLYHVVFRNTDPSPAANYASLDGVFMYQPTSPRQPLAPDSDWGQSVSLDGRAWSDLPDTVPILQLDYADGTAAGLGYMEVWVRTPQPVSGATRVREAFTVSGAPRIASSVAVRLMRLSGGGPLGVRLETSSGSLVEAGSIPASSIPVGVPGDHDGSGHATWVTLPFATPVTLATGGSYALTLSAPSDTVYSVFAIRKGKDYGFASSTYFADGQGQVSSGSGWGPFTQDGGGPLDGGDLQFYFR
jgi:hypothetical protein